MGSRVVSVFVSAAWFDLDVNSSFHFVFSFSLDSKRVRALFIVSPPSRFYFSFSSSSFS